MKLNNVLLIENSEVAIAEIKKQFEENEVTVTVAKDDVKAGVKIKDATFQMIILDWHLDETSTSELAKLCLEKIRDRLFVPVVVYTEELASFQGEADDVGKLFPNALIIALGKDDVNYPELLGRLEEIHARPPLSLSEDLRQAMSISTERALYTLAEHSIDDLAMGLKTLIKTDPTP